jgi:hypothetical protein
MSTTTTPVFDHNYTEYQLNRGSFRQYVRQFYITHAEKLCQGPTLDFGCGVGDLLSLLPAGSLGLEINATTVEHCQKRGLSVELYDPTSDNYQLLQVPKNQYTTFMMSHVLEHLENADAVLKQLGASCHRLGIKKMILKVPGKKGYKSDDTHRTFVTKAWLKKHSLMSFDGWKCTKNFHFPFNVRAVGNVFTHNEFTIVFERDR